MSHTTSNLQDGHQLIRTTGLMLVLDTPKGRGVFASQPISQGTIIEVSPVLVLTSEEVANHTSKTCLDHYTYYWPSSDGKTPTQAIVLGLGSMFNHSTFRQNVAWSRRVESECVTYAALRDIAAGEELCISYGHARLWFKDTDDCEEHDSSQMRSLEAAGRLDVELEVSGLGGIEL